MSSSDWTAAKVVTTVSFCVGCCCRRCDDEDGFEEDGRLAIEVEMASSNWRRKAKSRSDSRDWAAVSSARCSACRNWKSSAGSAYILTSLG